MRSVSSSSILISMLSSRRLRKSVRRTVGPLEAKEPLHGVGESWKRSSSDGTNEVYAGAGLTDLSSTYESQLSARYYEVLYM